MRTGRRGLRPGPRAWRVLAPLLALAAACTFPDVTFLEPGPGTDAGGDGGGIGIDAGLEGASPVDGSAVDGDAADADPPDLRFDASGVDAAPRTDAEAPVDASSCDGGPWKCDCDHDGFLDDACVTREVAAGRDGGFEAGTRPGDCDDLDPVRNPAAGPRSDLPRPGAPGKAGDWNCDGVVDRNPPALACKAPTKLGAAIIGCNGGTDGYLAATACGETNDVWTCPSSLLNGACDPTVAQPSVKATCK